MSIVNKISQAMNDYTAQTGQHPNTMYIDLKSCAQLRESTILQLHHSIPLNNNIIETYLGMKIIKVRDEAVEEYIQVTYIKTISDFELTHVSVNMDGTVGVGGRIKAGEKE